jgi:uncharacterized protein
MQRDEATIDIIVVDLFVTDDVLRRVIVPIALISGKMNEKINCLASDNDHAGDNHMVKLTEEIKETLAATKHVWLATVSKDGTPNVVVIGAFKLLDDESMLISDQFFLKTMKNLQENSKVAVSWWGEKGGYQIKGIALIHKDDAIFKEDVEWMKVKAPRFAPKSAVVVKITEAYVLKAGPDAGKKLL